VPYAVAAEILFGSAEIVTFFLIFLVLSPFIGIAVGAKVFGPGKEYISAAMGLSNLVGILGLLVFAFSFRLGNEISVKQGLSFVVLFSIAFYAAVMMLIGLAFLPML
jgi:hypothetical protein